MKRLFIYLLSAAMAGSLGILSAAAVHPDDSAMQNDYLTLYVGSDSYDLGRYQLAAHQGDLKNSQDDGQGLTYENFYSSYTTIVINGQARRFGEGETVSAPSYDADQKVCTTVQRFGNVEVTQRLRFADGLGTGHEDMLLISYIAKNLSDQDVLVGVRILLDSELGKDDGGTLYVDEEKLPFTRTYTKADTLPQTWSVVSDNGEVTAVGKLVADPDKVIFANWNALYNAKWGNTLDSTDNITDSAAALVWDNQTLPAGQVKEYAVYYGVRNEASQDPQTSETSQTSQTSQTSETSQTSQTSQTSETSQTSQTSQTSETSQTSQTSQTSETSQTSQTSQQTSIIQPPDNVGTGDARPVAGLIGLLLASFGGTILLQKKKGGREHE